jgi:hypothetical protein
MAHSTAALGFRSFVMHSSAWPGRQCGACLISEELSGVTWEMVDHHDRNSSCYQNRFLGLGLEHSILEVLVESKGMEMAVAYHPY